MSFAWETTRKEFHSFFFAFPSFASVNALGDEILKTLITNYLLQTNELKEMKSTENFKKNSMDRKVWHNKCCEASQIILNPRSFYYEKEPPCIEIVRRRAHLGCTMTAQPPSSVAITVNSESALRHFVSRNARVWSTVLTHVTLLKSPLSFNTKTDNSGFVSKLRSQCAKLID